MAPSAAHRTLRDADRLAGVAEKRTDKQSIWFRFGIVFFFFSTGPEMHATVEEYIVYSTLCFRRW